MKNTAKLFILFSCIFLASSCTTLNRPGGIDCPDHVRYELFFGQANSDGSAVTEKEWQSFADSYITPRFDAGLTIINASGKWKDQKGKIVREDSKVVILIAKPSRESREALHFIRGKYVELYGQSSVLATTTCVEASF